MGAAREAWASWLSRIGSADKPSPGCSHRARARSGRPALPDPRFEGLHRSVPPAFPQRPASTRVRTADGPSRNHESIRCSVSGIASSAEARRNHSASPTEASPGENGTVAACNWPVALTTNTAAVRGTALCTRSRREVSATRSAVWRSVARNPSVKSAKCSSGASIAAATALAVTVRPFNASRSICAVCRNAVRPHAPSSSSAATSKATEREIRRRGATRQSTTRYTAALRPGGAQHTRERLRLGFSAWQQCLEVVRHQVMLFLAQSNHTRPLASDGASPNEGMA